MPSFWRVQDQGSNSVAYLKSRVETLPPPPTSLPISLISSHLRCDDLDVPGVRSVCEDLAAEKILIQRFAFVDGTDGHYYIDLMFETDRPKELWDLLLQRLYQSAEFGGSMRKSSMAMCQGQHGWDDYLLLHHYDSTIQRDTFPEI